MEGTIGLLVGAVIWGVIWAAVADKIMKDKGYENHSTWQIYGFLLGIIAVIVALCKPPAGGQVYAGNREADDLRTLKEYKELLDAGVISQAEFDLKKSQLLGK